TNTRTAASQNVLPAAQAQLLGKFMREVVTQGTGRAAAGASVPMAGKTGTAGLGGAPLPAGVIGLPPFCGRRGRSGGGRGGGGRGGEKGGYGGTAAAPAAAQIVDAAVKLGLIRQ